MLLPTVSRNQREQTRVRYNVCTKCPHAQGSPPKCDLAKAGCGDLAREGACPEGRFPGQTRRIAVQALAKPVPKTTGVWGEGKGAASWARLHIYALTEPAEADGGPWIKNFLSTLPCGDCRDHAYLYVSEHLISWGPGFFTWTADFHNAVNRRLGKSELSHEEARRRWTSLPTFFDGVYVLSLPADNDRRDRLSRELQDVAWPFLQPEVVYGGEGLPGGATAGCMAGHRKILHTALEAGRKCILILEDDATFRGGFTPAVSAFLQSVPNNWDALFLGHQNAWWRADSSGLPRAVKPGVVRSMHPHRLHAYALRGPAIQAAYDRLMEAGPADHADHALGELLGYHLHTYAPNPPLVGQAAGQSHLTGKANGANWWESNPRPPKRAVLCLNLSGDLRPNARNSQQAAAYRWGAKYVEVLEPLPSDTPKVLDEKLRLDLYAKEYDRVIYLDRDIIIHQACPNLFDLVDEGDFGISPGADSACMVFQPHVHDTVFSRARKLEVALNDALASTNTPTKVLDFIDNLILRPCDTSIDTTEWKSRREWPPCKEKIILLQCSRIDREVLRSLGWHGGYQLNDQGEDHALQMLDADFPRDQLVKRLRQWGAVIQNEASMSRSLPTIWLSHLDSKKHDLLRESFGTCLIDIEAKSVHAAINSLPDELRQEPVLSAPKVHLVTTIRNGDINLLPHFLKHYVDLGVQQICLCINTAGPGFSIDRVREVATGYPVFFWTYSEERCTDAWQEDEQRSSLRMVAADPDDWVLHADLDEFHQYPATLDVVLKTMAEKGISAVRGHFIDRLSPDGSLIPVRDDQPLFDQYPICANLTGRMLRGWTQKVMVSRYSVWTSNGHHSANHPQSRSGLSLDSIPFGSAADYLVHHFKWRAGLEERLRYRIPQMEATGECGKWVDEAKTILRYLEKNGRFQLDDPEVACIPCR